LHNDLKGREMRALCQSLGNLNNGSNDGLCNLNGRNALSNANVNIGSRVNC
jgi:hypothetical protein